MEAGVEDGRGGLRKVSRMIDKNGRMSGGNESPEGGLGGPGEMRGGKDREGEPMRSGLRARNAFRLRCVEV